MLRFSIRDVLWLTVVVAVCAAWYVERKRAAQREAEVAATVEKLRLTVEKQQFDISERGRLISSLSKMINGQNKLPVDYPIYYPPSRQIPISPSDSVTPPRIPAPPQTNPSTPNET